MIVVFIYNHERKNMSTETYRTVTRTDEEIETAYKTYAASGQYSKDQLGEIWFGLIDGLDVTWFAKPEYDHNQMYHIRMGMYDNLDVSQYADPKFNSEEMGEIRGRLWREQNKHLNGKLNRNEICKQF